MYVIKKLPLKNNDHQQASAVPEYGQAGPCCITDGTIV
jgi:hypothetical protein